MDVKEEDGTTVPFPAQMPWRGFETHKSRIKDLYINIDLPLKKVQQQIHAETGFKAS